MSGQYLKSNYCRVTPTRRPEVKLFMLPIFKKTGFFPGAVLAALVVLAGCSNEPEDGVGAAPETKARPVLTEPVRYASEQARIEAVGTARARHSIMLEPAVTGQVNEVNFQTGDYVEEGQVLVRLDDRDERLAVQVAEVDLANTKRELDRYQRSARSGGITESMLDEAANVVDQAELALQRAQVTFDYHTIRAPFSGHVGMSDLDPGAWIDSDTVIATLDDRSSLLVRFQLPEMLFGKLLPGDSVELRSWGDQMPAVTGEIVEVDTRVDETRRTFSLRARVDNESDELRPGMSFRILLTLPGNSYPLIPELSVQWGGEGAYVWTVEEGKAKRVTVNVVQRQNAGVLVDAELAEGLPIITEGVHLVRAGMDVRVVNAGQEDGGNTGAESEPEAGDQL